MADDENEFTNPFVTKVLEPSSPQSTDNRGSINDSTNPFARSSVSGEDEVKPWWNIDAASTPIRGTAYSDLPSPTSNPFVSPPAPQDVSTLSRSIGHVNQPTFDDSTPEKASSPVDIAQKQVPDSPTPDNSQAVVGAPSSPTKTASFPQSSSPPSSSPTIVPQNLVSSQETNLPDIPKEDDNSEVKFFEILLL